MTSDEFRLLAISKVLDEIGGIDIHARACELNGGNEPKDSHYLAAVREGLDQVVRDEFGTVQPSDVDGERYRWLKKMHDSGDEQWFVYGAHTDDLDAEIDAMRQSNSPRGDK